MHMQALEFSAKHVSAESNEIQGITFQNYSKFETCLDEKMQPIALEKNGSDTNKHHTYTKLLAT